jgi:hypothetical protein
MIRDLFSLSYNYNNFLHEKVAHLARAPRPPRRRERRPSIPIQPLTSLIHPSPPPMDFFYARTRRRGSGPSVFDGGAAREPAAWLAVRWWRCSSEAAGWRGATGRRWVCPHSSGRGRADSSWHRRFPQMAAMVWLVQG